MYRMNLFQVFFYVFVMLRVLPVHCQTESTTGDCNTPLTHGLRDDQFSASSEYDANHNASSARFGGGGWIADDEIFQYLQVDFEDIFEITKISFQDSDNGWYTRTFRISYSVDGYVWMPYKSRLSDEAFGNIFERQWKSTTTELNPSLMARYLTFTPVSYYKRPSLLIELYGCQHANASAVFATTVQQNIEVDTTWILSQSPILVNSTIGVHPAATLTIQAGVAVIFTSKSAGIQIWGTLVSNGISGLNVLFTSKYPVLFAHSQWSGIIQENGGNITLDSTSIRQAFTGVQGNGSRVRIDNCEIYSCVSGIRLYGGVSENSTEIITKRMILVHVFAHDNTDGLQVIGTSQYTDIYIGHSKFDSNIRNGISVLNWDTGKKDIPTHLFIYNSSFSKNLEGGIRCYDQSMTKFSIRTSVFYSNSDFGLFQERFEPKKISIYLNVSDSQFIENYNGIKYSLYCPYVYGCISEQPVEVILRNNSFSKNNQAVDLYWRELDISKEINIAVENNTFVSNSGDVRLSFKSDGNVRAYVENNSFQTSRFPLLAKGNKLNDTLSLQKNKFISCLSKYRNDIFIDIHDISAQILNNSFEHCTLSTCVFLHQGLGHSFAFNSFINTTVTSCYISVGQTYNSISNLNIDNNFWGLSNIAEVKAKVCDFFIDSSKAIAKLNYYFINEEMGIVNTANYLDSFRSSMDVENNITYIGGVINSNMDFSDLNGLALVLSRSLLVPKGVTVEIANVSITIKRNRGIRVYGTLTIGTQNAVQRNTMLKLEGTMSSNNKWNGINLSSAVVRIYSVSIYGMDTCLVVNGANSTIIISNYSSVDKSLKRLLDARISNGNISVLIEDTNVISSSYNPLLMISTLDSDVELTIERCSFTCKNKILSVSKSTLNDDITLMNLYISRSYFMSSYLNGMFLEGCSSHIKSVITDSALSSICEYDRLIFFHFLSMDISAINNQFGNSDVSLKFSSCNGKSTNYTKEINVIGNNFNNSRFDGTDLDMYLTSYGQRHIINIVNNTFDGHHLKSRKGIIYYGFLWGSPHTLTIDSNLFKNYETIVIRIDNILQDMIIRNNTFLSNKQCLYVSDKLEDGLRIVRNTFVKNSHQSGIILLSSDELGLLTCNITENYFEDNNGTVISFRWQNTRLKHNIFDNRYAFYNVKVLPDDITNSEGSIDASLNYWGTTDARVISKVIYDFDFDSSLLDVKFRPYLGSKNTSDVQNIDIDFISESGEIGGKVDGNVTLKLSDSPFLVISNIIVEEGDTLRIEAGVILIIRQGAGVYVKGRFIVLGETELPIKFIPETPDLPWRGIEIHSNEGCEIFNLIINDTEVGITITDPSFDISNLTSTFSRKSGLSIIFSQRQSDNNGTYEFSNLTINNNDENGVAISGRYSQISQIFSFLIIQNSVISQNKENGIKMFSDAGVIFYKCDISQNGESGIYISQSTRNEMIYVNNSVISSNQNYAINGDIATGIILDSCKVVNHIFEYYDYFDNLQSHSFIELKYSWGYKVSHRYILFRNNLFQNNIAEGICIKSQFYWSSLGLLEIHFDNNIFSGSRRSFLFKTSSGDLSQIEIFFNNNTFENNTLRENNDINQISFNGKMIYYVEMKHNLVNGNMARSFLAVYNSHTNGNVSLTGNKFDENVFSSSVIDIQNYVPFEFHENIIGSSNIYNCALGVPDFHFSYYVNATHNYWGTHLAEEVVEKVCGFEKNMSKSLVLVLPYYENKMLSLISSSGLFLGDSFGGEIKEDLHISRDEFNSTLEIFRSIIVRAEAHLHIRPGVKLLFWPNRGIFVQGTLTINGQDIETVLDSLEETFPWHGIVVNTTSSNGTGKVVISDARIKNMLYGIVIYTPTVDIKRTQILNCMKSCITLTETKTSTFLDFGGTTLQSCGDVGIHKKGAGAVVIANADIRDTSVGIKTDMLFDSLEVRSCSISNCTVGIYVASQNHDANSSVSIIRNIFNRISSKALHVKFEERTQEMNNTNRKILVELNTFQDVCGINIKTWNHVMTTFRDNDLNNAMCLGSSECFMTALANGTSTFDHNRLIDISSNRFENLSAKCIIHMQDGEDVALQSMFIHNIVKNNRGSDGVIKVDSRYFNISENVLDNADSIFDVITSLEGKSTVNVTKNWWGTSDISHVLSRILDQRRIPELIRFEIEPILLTGSFNCRNVNNCSSHGECIGLDNCRCISGWKGNSCQSFDCGDVNNCYGNGDCAGPNTCSCYDGWYGNRCISASCSQVNNCSGHGFCVEPNICVCALRFTGSDCNTCEPHHGGPSCEPCPECQHGSCSSQTGLCECVGNNWAGYLCDRCNVTFYGPDCLPLVKVLEIIPSSGPEKGGYAVHIWGHNFIENVNGTYKCRFGSIETDGKWLTKNHVVCTAPQQSGGEVIVEISTDGTEFTNDKLTFYYYSTCPPESCGRNMTPSRGYCLFDSCSCYLPWKGDNCTLEILPLILVDVVDVQTVNESDSYTQQLKLKQGDLPVRWYLYLGPIGMTVDEETGLVQWASTVAKSQPYIVEVRASNMISEVSAKWSIMVVFSYTVSVERIEPRERILPFPQSVKIFGMVQFGQQNTPQKVPVEVIVLSQRTKHETSIHVESDELFPSTFSAIYNPRPDDSGLFSVSARHPGNPFEPLTFNITWSVLGMICKPFEVVIDEIIFPDETFVSIDKISTLVNVGTTSITGIEGEVDGPPGTFVRKSGDSINTSFSIQKFNMNDSISFDLVIADAKPFHGYMYILFTSSQGSYTSMRVNIKLNIKKPILVLEPNLIRVDVMPGSIKIVDVNITNIGEVSARNVSVSLPTDSRFSLVSFTVEKHKLTDSNYTDILSKDTAQLSIAIVIGGSDSLGEISGNIYINSLSTSSRLPFTVYISSTETTNVTFTVKDEYTYFAIGSPLVTNATITLSNPRRGFLEIKTTENETGFVIFENVYEDQYTIFVEAENHSSYGAVILISPSKSHHEIFLPRIAVKYTWTVEATTFKDVYTIALESTFETYVPIPVVTVQPSHIDTLPLEQKETSEIEFTITNHGLIQANNVRFAFPTSHPYLTFTSMVEMIGIIAANTSIVVPVKTMRNQREKRSTGSFCVDILLIYDYQCSGRQTRSALVRLTRGNSEPSCGRIIFTGGLLYGTLIFVGYAGTSTLTCDCLSTLVESCALSFLPGAGCVIASKNLFSRSHSRSDTKDTVIGVLDMVMGCIVSRINPLIGNLYTAARCVMDVNEKCSSGRKRREINSDILTALIKSSAPIINFLNMGQEIFGTRYITLEDTWYTEFKRGAADDTQLDAMISETEYSAIIDNLSEVEKKSNVSRFIQRFNNTVAAWENGTLSQLEDSGQVISFKRLQAGIDQFHNDNDKSKALGYDSIFDEYGQLVKSYHEAKKQESSSEARKKEGVCARVRIRIEQELVLTRDAFKAKLEIENGEKFDLENIKVEIKIIQTFGSEELQNEKFSIGKLTLVGISGIDGERRLGLGLSGSAEWLIIPYSTAALEDDTEYDIGGQLSYSVDGTELSVSLLPDTITVSPNPSLVVHYFHEKYVRGDDALTPEIEPIVPFTLAVMVMNAGYGVAKALKLTSGQPEIIENEKGLLVSFKIIAAQLENQAITPSLSVDFGDIHSHATKTARWLMTSSLMGKFFNYSATFENINPLGDPQLSLIDRLEYHDLVHLVRIQFPYADDGLDDFLVNNFPDQDSFPDMLYDSANGSSVSQVFKANVTDIKWKTYTNPSMKVYKQVNLTVSVKEVMWFYARIENTFTRQLSTSEDLLNVVTQSGRIILLEKNVWQTTHIFDKFFLHLFDFVQSENVDEDLNGKEIIYILTYGPKNYNAPHISASSYNVNMTNEEKVGSNIVNVTAYDNDNDNVMFELKNNSDNLFAIQQITQDSVAVVLNARIISTGTFVVELVVKDDGIPTRSSSISIHISITEEGIDVNSTRRTSPLTTETPMSTKPSDPSNSTDVQKPNTTTSLEAYDDTDDTFPLFIPLTIGGIIIFVVMVTAGIVYCLRRDRTDSRSNTIELD